MSVKIRMTRMGRRHRPYYRINVVDSRTPRDGRILEKVGQYDPIEKDKDKQVLLNRERIEHWISVGAIPSDTVAQILKKHGIESKHYQQRVARRAKARELAKKAGVPFTEADRIAAQKAAEARAKAEEEAAAAAKAKAEQEAKAAEEAKKAEQEAKAAEEAEKAGEEKQES